LSGDERSRVYRVQQLEVRPDPEGYEVSRALCNSRPTGIYRFVVLLVLRIRSLRWHSEFLPMYESRSSLLIS
jgi:hypothetical protein